MPISITRLIAALTLPLAVAPPSWLGRLTSLRGHRRRTATLDLDHAPEPLLRDLGILDGRGVVHPEEGRGHG